MFDRLRGSYNFPGRSGHLPLFVELLEAEIRLRRSGSARVLDIGCGGGIGRDPTFTGRVASLASEMWGVEPDPHAQIPEEYFANVARRTLAEATLPEGYFDVAYAFMVVEHIEHPRAFADKLCRVLKPGGVFLAVTPNLRHLFGLASRTVSTLGVETPILNLLRGRDHVDEYHYPVRYKLNSGRAWLAALRGCPDSSVEFAFSELETSLAGYLPGPLRAVRGLLNWKRRVLRDETQLLHMFIRLTR